MGNLKSKKAKAAKQKPKSALKKHEITAMERAARLTYSWRYVDHERAESGASRSDDCHGVNMLMPSTKQKIEAAYAIASGISRYWQVIVILYLNKDGQESRNWAWVKSAQPIIASYQGITPLIAEANKAVLSSMSDDEHCHARAVVMAPWDERHPVHPVKLCSALKKRLKLSDDEIEALGKWEEPETVIEISVENDLDLEIAKALREKDGLAV